MSGYQNQYATAPQYYNQGVISPAKDEQMTLILAIIGLLLGLSGIHRIYLGQTMSGLVQLFFSPVFYAFFGWLYCYLPFFLLIWIWNIVDIIQYREMTAKANYSGF